MLGFMSEWYNPCKFLEDEEPINPFEIVEKQMFQESLVDEDRILSLLQNATPTKKEQILFFGYLDNKRAKQMSVGDEFSLPGILIKHPLTDSVAGDVLIMVKYPPGTKMLFHKTVPRRVGEFITPPGEMFRVVEHDTGVNGTHMKVELV